MIDHQCKIIKIIKIFKKMCVYIHLFLIKCEMIMKMATKVNIYKDKIQKYLKKQ
jgi:hypothetical protein